jgi:hypothetical protein
MQISVTTYKEGNNSNPFKDPDSDGLSSDKRANIVFTQIGYDLFVR